MVSIMTADDVKQFFRVLKDGGLDKIGAFTHGGKPIVSDREHIDEIVAVLEGKIPLELEGKIPVEVSERGPFLWKKADHYRGVQNRLANESSLPFRESGIQTGGEHIHYVLEQLRTGNPEIDAQVFYAAMTTALLNGALHY